MLSGATVGECCDPKRCLCKNVLINEELCRGMVVAELPDCLKASLAAPVEEKTE